MEIVISLALCVQISTPAMLKAGVNPIEVLLWSRNKSLAEVEQALQAVRGQREFDFTKDRGFVLKNNDETITEGEGGCQSGKHIVMVTNIVFTFQNDLDH